MIAGGRPSCFYTDQFQPQQAKSAHRAFPENPGVLTPTQAYLRRSRDPSPAVRPFDPTSGGCSPTAIALRTQSPHRQQQVRPILSDLAPAVHVGVAVIQMLNAAFGVWASIRSMMARSSMRPCRSTIWFISVENVERQPCGTCRPRYPARASKALRASPVIGTRDERRFGNSSAPLRGTALIVATACADSGTQCSNCAPSSPFMRSLGIRQSGASPSSPSNSFQAAPTSSPGRTPVRASRRMASFMVAVPSAASQSPMI